jgi:hypothetical protein
MQDIHEGDIVMFRLEVPDPLDPDWEFWWQVNAIWWGRGSICVGLARQMPKANCIEKFRQSLSGPGKRLYKIQLLSKTGRDFPGPPPSPLTRGSGLAGGGRAGDME